MNDRNGDLGTGDRRRQSNLTLERLQGSQELGVGLGVSGECLGQATSMRGHVLQGQSRLGPDSRKHLGKSTGVPAPPSVFSWHPDDVLAKGSKTFFYFLFLKITLKLKKS